MATVELFCAAGFQKGGVTTIFGELGDRSGLLVQQLGTILSTLPMPMGSTGRRGSSRPLASRYAPGQGLLGRVRPQCAACAACKLVTLPGVLPPARQAQRVHSPELQLRTQRRGQQPRRARRNLNPAPGFHLPHALLSAPSQAEDVCRISPRPASLSLSRSCDRLDGVSANMTSVCTLRGLSTRVHQRRAAQLASPSH
jgi:hypothetical protein